MIASEEQFEAWARDRSLSTFDEWKEEMKRIMKRERARRLGFGRPVPSDKRIIHHIGKPLL